MRLIDQPIQVTLRDRRPVTFRWRGATYRIARVVDRWSYMGRWWAGEGEWKFWRVVTAGGGEFELMYDVRQQVWRLYRIYD
ncbi:MAG: hypothetical protein BAA04_13575 [Firmicutes bacterium ZCTH02-B6]|nr:MAG: hypothetical protein BAA04_13575 [Firmicutes bacterium ZCTH02-B6]